MKPIIAVITGVVGLAGGFGIGYFVANKKNQKILSAREEEIIAEARAFYKDRFNGVSESEEEGGENVEFDDNEAKYVAPPDSYTSRMNAKKADRFGDARAHNEEIRYDKPPEVNTMREAVSEELEIDPNDGIYIITPEEFGRGRVTYDKLDLNWWPHDQIITDDNDDILDVPSIIGTEWQERIGQYETDTVYVRNEKMESDFVITMQHRSYKEFKS